MKHLQPAGWPRPKGYANGISVAGRMIFVAGQVGWTPEETIATDDFAGQARQALENIVAILAVDGAEPQHLCRMTWFVLDKDEYEAAAEEVGRIYRDIIGRHFPAMTLVQVANLLEPGARLEIEATAVVPD